MIRSGGRRPSVDQREVRRCVRPSQSLGIAGSTTAAADEALLAAGGRGIRTHSSGSFFCRACAWRPARRVAGYSRLMEADEEGTLERLKALCRELIDPKIAEHHGRIVKTTGDGMLVGFASVVDAVVAAIGADDPDRLSAREIVITCNLLLVAGNLTTTDLIGNGILALLRHPDQLAKLRAHPELISNAVEEMLRYDPPVVQMPRIALEPLEIAGKKVRAGQVMNCSLLAAGHDPVQHPDPHSFDIERADTTHLAFGGGAHFCLGAPLARAEAQIAIAALFERFPVLQLDPQQVVEHKRAPVFNGLEALWVRAT